MIETYYGKNFPEGFIIEQYGPDSKYHVFAENMEGSFYLVEVCKKGEWIAYDEPELADGVFNYNGFTVVEHGVKYA